MTLQSSYALGQLVLALQRWLMSLGEAQNLQFMTEHSQSMERKQKKLDLIDKDLKIYSS